MVDTAFGAIRLVDNVSDGRFSIFTPGGMVYWFGTLGAAEDAAEAMRVMWEAGIDAEREMGMKPYSYNDSMVEGRR